MRVTQDLIDSYLWPLVKDKKKEEKEAMELKQLRNSLSAAFLLLNAIFIVVIFSLQLNMDKLSIPWPCGEGMRVEPLGFVFMVMFGAIMSIQVIGMIFHRTSTFLHVVSTTRLNCFSGSDEDVKRAATKKNSGNAGGLAQRAAVDDVERLIVLAKNMGKMAFDDRMSISSGSSRFSTWRTDPESALADGDDVRTDYNNRRTVIKLDKNQRHHNRQLLANSVTGAFERRFAKFEEQLDDDDVDDDTIRRKVRSTLS